MTMQQKLFPHDLYGEEDKVNLSVSTSARNKNGILAIAGVAILGIGLAPS
jgi:hypothetical protein